jgi:outer membrane protein assembly factor BamB
VLAAAATAGAEEERESAARRPEVLWTVETASDSKGSAAVADIDGDGKLEIVFGTYFNDRHVYALAAEDGRVQWKFLSDRGPLDASVTAADLDADGKLEVLAADSSSGNLFCLGGDGKEMWRLELPNSTDSPPAIADLDGDGGLEIAVGSMWLGGGKGHLGVYRAADRKPLWQREVPGCVQSEPCLVDLNGDEALDVLVTSWRGDRGVHAFAGKDGAPLWKFETAGSDRSMGMYHGPSVVHAKGEPRIVVGTCDGDVYALSAAGKQIWHVHLDGEYLFAPTTAADLDGDAEDEIIVGGRSHLYLLSADDGALKWKRPVNSHVERGAVVADVDDDGSGDILYCEGTRFFALNAASGKALFAFDANDDEKDEAKKSDYWRSISSAPVVADFDGDGSLDVFFVVGKGLYGEGGKLMKDNYGRGYALRLGGKGEGWRTFRGNLHRTGRAGP